MNEFSIQIPPPPPPRFAPFSFLPITSLEWKFIRTIFSLCLRCQEPTRGGGWAKRGKKKSNWRLFSYRNRVCLWVKAWSEELLLCDVQWFISTRLLVERCHWVKCKGGIWGNFDEYLTLKEFKLQKSLNVLRLLRCLWIPCRLLLWIFAIRIIYMRASLQVNYRYYVVNFIHRVIYLNIFRVDYLNT